MICRNLRLLKLLLFYPFIKMCAWNGDFFLYYFVVCSMYTSVQNNNDNSNNNIENSYFVSFFSFCTNR